MAFGTSRIFKSTDVGAPQFNNAAGSLNAVLKAVLCTGYGSTASLGWTVEFESGNVLVVRMKGGTRTFIQFDDTLTGSYTYVAAYSTMSSAFTGTERMPAAGQPVSYIVKKSAAANTSNVNWIIIGDDAGFYLWHKPRKGTNTGVSEELQSLTYFGDYIPLNLKDKWNFCLLGNTNLSGYGIYRHSNSLSIPHYTMRSYLFNKGATPIGIHCIGSGGNGQLHLLMSLVQEYTYLKPTSLFNGVIFNVGHLYLYVNGFTSSSPTSIGIGILPGIYSPAISSHSETIAPTFTAADISNLEFTQTNGTTMICGTVHAAYGYAYYNYPLMFTFASLLVGEGFRNV